MDDKPLEVTLRAGVQAERLLADIEAQLVGNDRACALLNTKGVALRAVWETDLDAAIQTCRDSLPYDLRISPTRVRFLDGRRRKDPVMKVRVTVPEHHLGDVVGEMNGRQAWIENLERVDGNTRCIRAVVPLKRLLGYTHDLHRMTNGQGTLEVHFHDYQVVPFS